MASTSISIAPIIHIDTQHDHEHDHVIPSTQPDIPGFWMDNGVLTFFSGTQNIPMDFNDGESLSVFGTPLGDV